MWTENRYASQFGIVLQLVGLNLRAEEGQSSVAAIVLPIFRQLRKNPRLRAPMGSPVFRLPPTFLRHKRTLWPVCTIGMDVFSRIIASRFFAWVALAAPGIVLLVIPTLKSELGIDPLKELFQRSGEIAVWTLGTVLCLSPLKTLFPRSKIIAALNRHRRSVGVTAFIYALLHVNLNFIYEGGIQSYFASILEPFFLAGTFGFLILLLLTSTSNDWSVRKLGFALWKWIHRLAYLAALVLFYHQGTAGRGNWGIAFALFIPVASLEALRIGKMIVVWGFSRFIAREKDPAWTGWREFILENRVPESDTITSFYLKPKDGRPLQPFRSGQYLTVQVDVPGQPHPAVRTYTISDAPSQSYFRLSIKREREPGLPAGIVSNWFHDHFEVGNVLLAKAPAGQFYLSMSKKVTPGDLGSNLTLRDFILRGLIASRVYRRSKDDLPIVLISAGVGITPMICMLNALIGDRVKRPIFFIHGARNRSEHAFADHVRSIGRSQENLKIHIAYSRPSGEDLLGQDYDSQGRIGIKIIQELVPSPYGDFFLCGPGNFMKQIYEDLAQWGVELERIHFESFGPATVAVGNTASATTNAKHRICFYPANKSVVWDGTSTLLDCALSNGFKPRYGCRSGVCGTCSCKLLKGAVSYIKTPAAATTKDTVLLCCARPESDVTVAFPGSVERERAKETGETE